MTTYSLDANHNDIVQRFRQYHCPVDEIARSQTSIEGIPDITVGIRAPQTGYSSIIKVEIKTPGSDLRPTQKAHFENWHGLPVFRVDNFDEVDALVWFFSNTPLKWFDTMSLEDIVEDWRNRA